MGIRVYTRDISFHPVVNPGLGGIKGTGESQMTKQRTRSRASTAGVHSSPPCSSQPLLSWSSGTQDLGLRWLQPEADAPGQNSLPEGGRKHQALFLSSLGASHRGEGVAAGGLRAPGEIAMAPRPGTGRSPHFSVDGTILDPGSLPSPCLCPWKSCDGSEWAWLPRGWRP